MKALIMSSAMVLMVAQLCAQTCPTCNGYGPANLAAGKSGPSLHISMGKAQYGQAAGNLGFSSPLADSTLLTPLALQFDSTNRTDVIIVMTNLLVSSQTEVVDSSYVLTTNWVVVTNSGVVVSNMLVSLGVVLVTNQETVITPQTVIRQVIAPQAAADVLAPTTNGYTIDYYFTNQVAGYSGGVYSFRGAPFATWMITNPAPYGETFQVQISKISSGVLLKQWTYIYTSGGWVVQTLDPNVQSTGVTTDLGQGLYQVVNTVGSPNAVSSQSRITYKSFGWGSGPVTNAVGSDNAPELTVYTYYDPSPYGSGSPAPVQSVTDTDGSWEYYPTNGYDTHGNPLIVYSAYGDVSLTNYLNARETVYTYTPGDAGISTQVDNGTISPHTPRRAIEYIQNQNQMVSLRYTVFPSLDKRIDVQCTTTTAAWNTPGNLCTTNIFYTNGPNQFALEAVVNPDGTATTYNYIVSSDGAYQTNITATGQVDSTFTNIVDGTISWKVLNQFGNLVASGSQDVKTGATLSQDSYSNFDSYSRPQSVTHLDGTTEQTTYATCCGLLASTTDRDSVTKLFLYDATQRQTGFVELFDGITYTNTLDAAGRVVQSVRIPPNGPAITLSQSQYDLAGELIAQTNALGGGATHTRSQDQTTGGLIITSVNPDAGRRVESYYLDGMLKSVTGTAAHGVRYVYGAGSGYKYTGQIQLNSDGSDSSEATTNYMDMLGRTYQTVYADGSSSQSFYNNLGQLWKQTDADRVATLYLYNGKGELAYRVIDCNQNGSMDVSGNDRITWTTNDVIADLGTIVRRTQDYVWTANNVPAPTLISMTEISTNGLDTWQTVYRDINTPVVTHTQTSYSGGGSSRSVTTTSPDNSYTMSIYSYGRLSSVTRYNTNGMPIANTTYTYDANGRQSTVTDARNGVTTYDYNDADLVTSVITPNPGTLGGSPQTTTTSYNTSLQATSVAQPDGTSVTSSYLPTGELGGTYGSRTYPVAYGYDYGGRMKTMTNWSNFGSGGVRVTTWNYDGYRGFLTNKLYDGGAAGPFYTYTPAGRLLTREWARGITTSYAYDTAGTLTNVSYSDSTPGVATTYDRLGRPIAIACNGMTDALAYDLANDLLGESFSGGTLDGLAVTNSYDQYLRRTNLASLSGVSTLAKAMYGYDNASRLSTVSDGANNATYTYLANSPLIGQITFKSGSVTRMTTSKQYDYLNRLTQISSASSASSAVTFNYSYNNANERTRVNLADGSYWLYQYDSLGQVTTGNKYWSDETPVAGQQFDYTFDTIGNRTQTRAGGDQTGGNLRTANYYANNLNQLTNRDVPGYVDVTGVSIATNTVTVNGQTAYRKVEYFRDQLGVNNRSSALWTNMIVAGTGQTSVTGNVYVAQQPETFNYDADGNLTNDGRFSYAWDGENRLTNMTSLSGAPMGSRVKLDFAYDYHGRRIQKIVSTNNGSVYIAQSTNKFLYDGWNVVAETGPNNALIRSYMWGADLSGSAQGAGGVGGLLEVSYYGSSTTNCFPAFDGNGNVAALVNAADGTAAANYEYGPFGEVIRATGPMAKANPFRWSTKYQDDESDLVMYPARPYSPSTGRFLSCDPIAELGGLNLYGFVQNNPVQGIDPLGLYNWGTPGEFLIQKELNSIDGKWYTRSSVKGNWFAKRPGDGTPCCEKPAQLQGRRTDTRGWISGINMSVELSFTGGPYKELILLWMTCYLPDLTAGVRMQCINSTTCSIPTTWGGQFFGSYLTTAEVSYLSCEGGKWTTKRAGFVRDY